MAGSGFLIFATVDRAPPRFHLGCILTRVGGFPWRDTSNPPMPNRSGAECHLGTPKVYGLSCSLQKFPWFCHYLSISWIRLASEHVPGFLPPPSLSSCLGRDSGVGAAGFRASFPGSLSEALEFNWEESSWSSSLPQMLNVIHPPPELVSAVLIQFLRSLFALTNGAPAASFQLVWKEYLLAAMLCWGGRIFKNPEKLITQIPPLENSLQKSVFCSLIC